MVSLWRSKKADDQDDPESTQETNAPREADESTRLLPSRPPPPRYAGYLDPDDPAVSSPQTKTTEKLLKSSRSLHTISGQSAAYAA